MFERKVLSRLIFFFSKDYKTFFNFVNSIAELESSFDLIDLKIEPKKTKSFKYLCFKIEEFFEMISYRNIDLTVEELIEIAICLFRENFFRKSLYPLVFQTISQINNTASLKILSRNLYNQERIKIFLSLFDPNSISIDSLSDILFSTMKISMTKELLKTRMTQTILFRTEKEKAKLALEYLESVFKKQTNNLILKQKNSESLISFLKPDISLIQSGFFWPPLSLRESLKNLRLSDLNLTLSLKIVFEFKDLILWKSLFHSSKELNQTFNNILNYFSNERKDLPKNIRTIFQIKKIFLS